MLANGPGDESHHESTARVATEPAVVTMEAERRPRRGLAPVLIVVPSLISALGLVFILVSYLSNNQIVTDVFFVLGAILLFLDFFITMAIFRFTVRNIDARLHRIERMLGSSEERKRQG